MEKGVILVTGAAKRLGAAIAIDLLVHGWKIIAHYHSSRGELEQFLDQNQIYTSQVSWWNADFPADLSSASTLPWNTISGIINSVATFQTGNIFDTENWLDQCNLNVFIPVELTRMYRAFGNGGTIINLIDSIIDRVHPRYQNYRLSKLLLRELTRQMAVTIGPNFRVNGIAPGTVIPPEHGDLESYHRAVALAPSGRPVISDSITKTVRFILENQDINGQIIAVDGGVQAL